MMIHLQSIYKNYGSQQVLKNIDFSADVREFISIIGKSGVGKTTLLAVLAGLVKPDHGRLLFQNEDISGYNEEQFARFRLLNIGIIFQDFKIIPSLSVFDNVYLALHPRRDFDRKTKQELVAQVIGQVGIHHKLSEKVEHLSGGEKQRVAIARSLVANPKMVLADEPTGNLDEKTAEDILDLFQKLHNELATTFIIITHDKDIAGRAQKRFELTGAGLTALP